MPSPVLDEPDKLYTYGDLIAWDDENRYEILKGRVYMMTTPHPEHQEILMNLAAIIHQHLKGGDCKVYPAPFSVNLEAAAGLDSRNGVEPDITIICDKSKVGKNGYNGAPPWVIEIESLSTSRHDLSRKHAAYMAHGVREYWFVKPGDRAVIVFLFKEGQEEDMLFYNWDDDITSDTQPDLTIKLTDIFPG